MRGENGMELKMDPTNDEAVPFAIWDPDKPEQNATKFSHLARPLRVTLNPGDMLYLPAMWFVILQALLFIKYVNID
jgi:jumonji domain-containing protein 7